MHYSVEIERIGVNGLPVGPAAVQAVRSESEAIAVMRDAIRRAHRSGQMMTFSVYGPEKRHVLSYTSEALKRVAEPVEAFDP